MILRLSLGLVWLVLMGVAGAAEIDRAAEKAGRDYMAAIFAADATALAALMAPEVTLLPGHELLKKEYGLSGGNRRAAVVVKREDVCKLYVKTMGSLPEEKRATIREVLPKAVYAFTLAQGDRVILGNDGEGGDNYRVPTQPGDVVLQFSLERGGDFCVYVLRQIDGKWLVVADYTD